MAASLIGDRHKEHHSTSTITFEHAITRIWAKTYEGCSEEKVFMVRGAPAS
jgi:hypothetical protein